MGEVKNRARLAILSYIAQFSLMKDIGGRVYEGSPDMRFTSGYGDSCKPIVGDLVAMTSAPPSKWYLSWYHGTADGGARHVLESIEDGQLCRWGNVGFAIYNRENVAQHPEWRWTDQQYAFNDRWLRACKRERDAYIYLPTWAKFDGDDATLGVRVRYGLDSRILTTSLPNWRKLKIADMLAVYDAHVATLKVKEPDAELTPPPTGGGGT